ncbi:4a-hydroxytetrahydrobiopterin dehydratase [Rhizobium sp. SG_E_25_P2]|uniref:4a-hydroxytetrahydrobiopterin dehydratase n=1 Tax=Rhizobium sp. SG_E_25_P2 TaxID=2879942 RepID=UPI002473E5D6|nr:4a-hydroxytetrahydrobiopterin dehydratase [Rhizobium sp. SG_E_25_P2]MDH6267611.1 4a-hydroxytetrahydrobiopterin dehydratase [Rhizobium sp. SG_E_25_P2]
MARDRLTPSEIEQALQGLDGWTLSESGDAISRRFRFADFASAFGFMAECAIYAEKIDHHPEWSNVYRNVDVSLTTHSAKGLTELDVNLARYMNKVQGRH